MFPVFLSIAFVTKCLWLRKRIILIDSCCFSLPRLSFSSKKNAGWYEISWTEDNNEFSQGGQLRVRSRSEQRSGMERILRYLGPVGWMERFDLLPSSSLMSLIVWSTAHSMQINRAFSGHDRIPNDHVWMIYWSFLGVHFLSQDQKA